MNFVSLGLIVVVVRFVVVIASAAKQSISPPAAPWIASLRSQ
jgi:hypothetical protein